jgi:hypothetical protein
MAGNDFIEKKTEVTVNGGEARSVDWELDANGY